MMRRLHLATFISALTTTVACAQNQESVPRAIPLPDTLGANFAVTDTLGAGVVCLRAAQALAAMNKAVSLDPLSMLIRTGVGDAYYFAREYAKSALHYRMSFELDPRFDGAHTDLARALEALGQFDEARAAYEEGRRLAGGVAARRSGRRTRRRRQATRVRRAASWPS